MKARYFERKTRVELKGFENTNKKELAMVNVAKAVLDNVVDVMHFNDLMAEVSDFLEMTDDEIEQEMGQFYTDLNIDGRFISVGDNRWGLREWYPVDSIDEELTQENDIELITPKQAADGFDDLEHVEEELLDEAERRAENDDDEEMDEENMPADDITDEGDDELDEYSDDIENIEDDDAELDGLSIVDDEDVLEVEEDEEE